MRSDTTCQFCGATIRWCVLADDERVRVALDAVRVAGGSYNVCGANTAQLIPAAKREGMLLYRKHGETCRGRKERATYYREKHRGVHAGAGAARAALDTLNDQAPHVWRKAK